jgi:hypothetical protein
MGANHVTTRMYYNPFGVCLYVNRSNLAFYNYMSF